MMNFYAGNCLKSKQENWDADENGQERILRSYSRPF